ncbi:hypothetical protein DXG01_007237 [Tephrocybe rancida]|nr:hypothetical protein DXG01_007237 [Tephrocybe rancida]
MVRTLQGHDAIVTPYKLPYLDIRRNIRTLLSSTERARPWILYLTPGLLVAELLKVAISLPAITSLRNLVLPSIPHSGEDRNISFILRFSAYIILIVLGTSIIVPLEIISTRLTLQRNHAPQDDDGVDESATADPALSLYSAEEDVIGYSLLHVRRDVRNLIHLADCETHATRI